MYYRLGKCYMWIRILQTHPDPQTVPVALEDCHSRGVCLCSVKALNYSILYFPMKDVLVSILAQIYTI